MEGQEPTPSAEPTEPSTEEPAEPQTPAPAETVEFWKEKAREQEKRAKANASAAKRLTEIEEAQKTEAEKAADRLRQLEEERDEAVRNALRFKVASKHGISDEDVDLFLTGTDEETLTKQAQRLTQHASDRKKNGNVVPKEGASTSTAPNDERAFVRDLFGSG